MPPITTGYAAPLGVRQPLAGRGFRQLLAVRLSSQFGDGVFQASLAGAVLFNPQRATDPADVAAAFAVLLLPYSLVGPFAGVLLDRWSRQRVLLWSNLVRCGLVVLVAAVIAAGVDDLRFYAAVLAVISVNRFVLAALSASLPHVTDDVALVSANALTTTVGGVSTVLGGAIGVGVGSLVGGGDSGYAGIALCAVLGYGASALLAAGFGAKALGPDPGELSDRPSVSHVLAGLVAGVRHIAARRPAWAALAAITAHRFLFGLATIASVLLYRNYFLSAGLFRAGLAGLTQVIAAGAAGAVLAAVVTPRAVRSMGKRRWIVLVLSLGGLAQLCFGLPYAPWGVVVGGAFLGFAGQAVKICVDTTVQETIEDSYRGRVFSVYDTAFNVAFVAAAILAAIVLPNTGKSYPVLLAVVAGYGLTAAGYAAVTRRARVP